jgi:phage repressor protein C with HTH and peptisase S24 domain
MANDDETLASRVKRRREHLQMSQVEVARLTGYRQQTLQAIESGQTARPGRIVELAAALQTTVEYLLHGAGPQNREPPKLIRPSGPEPSTVEDAPDAPRLSQLGDFDVEVRGITVGGSDDEFYFNGEVIDHVRRPPGIRHARNVFALNVSGDSMLPRYEPGEPIYAQRAHANPGDYVVVELYPEDENQAGKSFLKQLIRRTGLRITCKQLNPEKEIEFDAGEVKEIYRVLKPRELLG